MVMIAWPGNEPSQTVECIVCDAVIPITSATVGGLYHDGQPAFACEMHVNNISEHPAWMRAWVNFERQQAHNRTTFETRVGLGGM